MKMFMIGVALARTDRRGHVEFNSQSLLVDAASEDEARGKALSTDPIRGLMGEGYAVHDVFSLDITEHARSFFAREESA